MPRNDMTLSSKISLLDKIKSMPLNTSHRKISELTGVPKSTISRLMQQEYKLRDEWALHEGEATTSKRKRVGKNPDVEEALNQWVSIVMERGVNINSSLLKAKSEELAKNLGYNDFRATSGWLTRWKARQRIKFKTVQNGEKIIADNAIAEEWKNTKLPSFLEDYCADDIYNADETGLYYRATPDGSLCYKNVALSGYKNAMDRITVLCCTNMSGTDKQKLLVIGNIANPRCFEGLRMESLPVVYHANKNACMTSEIFRKWLISWDLKLQEKQRKILLLVDNCAAHRYLENLNNIRLEFLPPKTISLVQPMDMGVMKNLKTLYRARLVNYILESIDENLLTSSSTAKEISAKINLLQALQFVADSWRAIKSNTIQNCFAVCGLKPNQKPENSSDGENEDIHPVINIEEFLTIDINLPCYDENEDYEKTILEVIKVKQNVDEDDKCEENPPALVSHQEAKKCISVLQRYFMQVGNEGSPMYALNTCADFVEMQSYKDKRQPTHFFQN